MKYQVKCQSIPNMPWQDKPKNCSSVVWRYQNNPIIPRNPQPGISRIFNSAVVYRDNEFIGVFRCEDETSLPHLRVGHSADGINWKMEEERIHFKDEKGNDFQPYYAYDPRVVKVEGEDKYYVIWCTDFYGPTIGLAETKDFKTFIRRENSFLPCNRNGVLFPKKIKSRPRRL